jgi:excisionase family DNA binding protein
MLMTVDEVAALCQVHRKTIVRAISRGELRAARLGIRGAYRLREEDVEDWLASRTVSARRTEPAATAVRGFLVA